MRDFTKYDIWHDGIDFARNIYSQTQSFPNEEKFGLTSQLRRAAISIPSNFAEGCSRSSEKEYLRFIEMSLGSAFEVKTQLIIANRLGFLNESGFKEALAVIESLAKRLNGLRKKIKVNDEGL